VAESIEAGDQLSVGHGAGPVHVLSRVWR
jgi:hypothetical protein